MDLLLPRGHPLIAGASQTRRLHLLLRKPLLTLPSLTHKPDAGSIRQLIVSCFFEGFSRKAMTWCRPLCRLKLLYLYTTLKPLSSIFTTLKLFFFERFFRSNHTCPDEVVHVYHPCHVSGRVMDKERRYRPLLHYGQGGFR